MNAYNIDQDSTLLQLQSRIHLLKQQRNKEMNELIGQRKEFQLMQGEMLKMKKEKQYLQSLIKEKTTAEREYDRIITESQKTLMKLSENTKKLLLSVDNQYSKLLNQQMP